MRTLNGIQAVEISRAADATAPLVQKMSISHRRPNVTVIEEFLYRADVIIRLDPMGCERVTQWMSRHLRYFENSGTTVVSSDRIRSAVSAAPFLLKWVVSVSLKL